MPKLYGHMIGKVYLYNAKQYEIKDIVPADDGRFEVMTDTTFLTVTRKQLRTFLRVEGPVRTNGQSDKRALQLITKETDSMKDLSKILLGNITKIQTDPTFIPKARAINDTARTITAIAKARLDAIKLAKSLEPNRKD